MADPPPSATPDDLANVPPELADDPLVVFLQAMTPAQDGLYRGLAELDAADEAVVRSAAR